MERYLVVDLGDKVEILSWARNTKTVSFYTNAAGHTYWTRIKNDISPKVSKTNEKHGRVHSVHESIEEAIELANRLNVEKRAFAEKAEIAAAARAEILARFVEYVKENISMRILDSQTVVVKGLRRELTSIRLEDKEGNVTFVVASARQCAMSLFGDDHIDWDVCLTFSGEIDRRVNTAVCMLATEELAISTVIFSTLGDIHMSSKNLSIIADSLTESAQICISQNWL